jgi:hypothetical protein
MEEKILVSCKCEGTGFIAVADNGGDGVEHVECGQDHPAFEEKFIILDEVARPTARPAMWPALMAKVTCLLVAQTSLVNTPVFGIRSSS